MAGHLRLVYPPTLEDASPGNVPQPVIGRRRPGRSTPPRAARRRLGCGKSEDLVHPGRHQQPTPTESGGSTSRTRARIVTGTPPEAAFLSWATLSVAGHKYGWLSAAAPSTLRRVRSPMQCRSALAFPTILKTVPSHSSAPHQSLRCVRTATYDRCRCVANHLLASAVSVRYCARIAHVSTVGKA